MVIGQLAFSAHGLVKRHRLLTAGVTPAEIRSRLASGALLPEYRGVYRVGHRAPTIEARYLAAVWACGDKARLCGRAAGYLIGMLKGQPPSPEVAAPTVHRIPGVITHRSRYLSPADTMTHRSIPMTSVPRTLVDLAAVLIEEDLARAYHEAHVRYRIRPSAVESALARQPNAPGAARMRAVMYGRVQVTLSRLERRFVEILKEEDFAIPVMNRSLGGRWLDCRWPNHRVTVELDSYRYHGSRHAWENDRRREREAYARGDQFRRYTWGDVFENSTSMRLELRELLPRCDA